MTKHTTILLAVISLCAASCVKEPEARVTSNKQQIIIGDDVSFKNTSENAETYKWDFGDGVTSTVKEPTHTYKKIGEYSVEMTAFSKREKKSDKAIINVSVINEFPEGSTMIKFKDQEYELFPSCYLYSFDNYTMTAFGNNGNLICNIFLPSQPSESKTYNLKNSNTNLQSDEASVVVQEKLPGNVNVFWRSEEGELKITILNGRVSAWFTRITFTDLASGNESISGQITCP